jgi:dihydropyrimidine dehydrogenase (NAD+) subunit PreA
MFALENAGEMPLTAQEREELLARRIDINGRVKVTAIKAGQGKVSGLETVKVAIPAGACFSLKRVSEMKGCGQTRGGIDHVIIAIGSRSSLPRASVPGVFYAGDMMAGPSTVVEAVASGKNAAEEIDAFVRAAPAPEFADRLKSVAVIPGYNFTPVSLAADFFGRPISSPFLLSAAPPTDGLEQMKKAYEAGWSGGIMKTAFDNLPIHIPAGYMNRFNDTTYGNCDNVSGHALDRVCREIGELRQLYPDRLTGASTGGTVSGNDEKDRASWQANTKKLERAGTMAIEYSLSCPQGGEGAEGDIVSQNANLTAKIIDWVMQMGDASVPKLFKLTPAVTEITTIVKAVKAVFDRYPNKKAGITLGNTFPCLAFEAGEKKGWEEGIVVGMSGEAIAPINYLTLAKVSSLSVSVSGNGGPVNYLEAANFLALGVKTVQFCTLVEKYGYRIFGEMCSGVSHLMADRGMKSMGELIGAALPRPIRDFMALSPVKKISTVDSDLCVHCGNCSRCPYLAISLNEKKVPETDPEKCVGCRMCNYLCFVGALSMRDRTKEEAKALKEG